MLDSHYDKTFYRKNIKRMMARQEKSNSFSSFNSFHGKREYFEIIKDLMEAKSRWNLFKGPSLTLGFIGFIFVLLCFLTTNSASADELVQYLWAGANQYQLWHQTDERRRTQQLDAMVNSDLKVLRIFLSARDYLAYEDPPEGYTFENPLGVYHDDQLLKVDRLMQECQQRGIKMIVALENRTTPYLDTYGPIGIYQSPLARQYYKDRFNYFLNHVNPYLGKPWKDLNDIVLAWQIQNEPGVPLIGVTTLTSTEKHDLIRSFLTDLSSYLKSIDPDTDVALGIAGYASYYFGSDGGSGDDIRTLGNIPDADIYSLHFYGGNVSQWIDDNLSTVRSWGKRLFVEEFGNTRDTEESVLMNNYRTVTQTCRAKGIPWMFWRMGHRKGDTTWSIMDDDPVWQEIVAPEAALISEIPTLDEWNVHTKLISDASMVIDTFETYADDTSLRTFWNFDGDVTGVSLEKTNPYHGEQALRIDYSQNTSYFGSGFRSLPQLDVTDWDYLTFYYRGNTGIATIQVQSGNSGAQSAYSTLIPASTDWTYVSIPLESFSGTQPANFSSLIRIKFFLQNTANGAVYLDDIALIRFAPASNIPGWSIY